MAVFVALPNMITYWSSDECPETPCTFFLYISVAKDVSSQRIHPFNEYMSLCATILLVLIYRWGYRDIKKKIKKYDETSLTIAGKFL